MMVVAITGEVFPNYIRILSTHHCMIIMMYSCRTYIKYNHVTIRESEASIRWQLCKVVTSERGGKPLITVIIAISSYKIAAI
jgi:Na+-translocating ferredoxin:NAD+ oxidoreductase RnfC subunit